MKLMRCPLKIISIKMFLTLRKSKCLKVMKAVKILTLQKNIKQHNKIEKIALHFYYMQLVNFHFFGSIFAFSSMQVFLNNKSKHIHADDFHIIIYEMPYIKQHFKQLFICKNCVFVKELDIVRVSIMCLKNALFRTTCIMRQ